MTSNLGSDILARADEKSDAKAVTEAVMEVVKASFRPEFINRIDEISIFHKLNKENIKQITEIQLKNIEKRLASAISNCISAMRPSSGLPTTGMTKFTVPGR